MDNRVYGYRDLVVWQKAMDLVPTIYGLARRLPRNEVHVLGSQLRRAVVAIPASLAEGQVRGDPAEFARCVSHAHGSLAELDTLLAVARRLGYWNERDMRRLSESIVELRCLLHALLRNLRRAAAG